MKIWRWHSSDRSHRSSIWCSDITVPLGICCKRNRLSFVSMSHTIRLRPRWLLTTNNSCQTEEFVMSDENNRHDWKSMVILSSGAIAVHMVTGNVQQNVCSPYRGLLKSGRMNHGGLVIFVHSALVKLSWWTKAEHQTVKTASGRPIWIRIRPLFFYRFLPRHRSVVCVLPSEQKTIFCPFGLHITLPLYTFFRAKYWRAHSINMLRHQC